MMGDQYRECEPCSKKPGSPRLCDACYHNRKLVGKLQWEIKKLKEAGQMATDSLASVIKVLDESN